MFKIRFKIQMHQLSEILNSHIQKVYSFANIQRSSKTRLKVCMVFTADFPLPICRVDLVYNVHYDSPVFFCVHLTGCLFWK